MDIVRVNGWVALARSAEASWNDRMGRGLAQFYLIGGTVDVLTIPERLENAFYDELRSKRNRKNAR